MTTIEEMELKELEIEHRHYEYHEHQYMVPFFFDEYPWCLDGNSNIYWVHDVSMDWQYNTK